MSAAPTTRPTIPNPGLGVDLALLAVSSATAVTLVRAFRTWDELPRLLVVVVAAHLCSRLTRAARWGAIAATTVALAVGTLVITLLWYRSASTWGLPGPHVVETLLDDTRTAFGPFRDLVAPVDALPGFTVAFAIGLWLMATFADLAAARADAPLQAVAPQVAVFVFSSILLLGRHAAVATAVFVGAMVVYRLAVRASRLRPEGRGRLARRAVWAAGLPVVALVVAAGALLSDAFPTNDSALVDLRALGRGPEARLVDSPLVSIDALLGERSDTVLFTVESERPHYWRLTSLDRFDGRSWTASAKYDDLDQDEELPANAPAATPVDSESFEVSLSGLDSAWLPVVPAPRRVTAPIDLRYDDVSGSVFVADGESTANLSYRFDADVPQLSADLLAANSGATPATDVAVDPHLADQLELPDDFPSEARTIAADLTNDLAPYEAARSLEAFFRSERFVYDREVNYRGQNDPLMAFLQQGRGFCQQFATAFASMARSVGLPARVAVGFTYGESAPVGDDPASTLQRWTVRGRYAHAWPEVHIAGVGWVPFEPTPGRGNPDSTTYSTATPAQAGPDGESVELGATTTTTTTTTIALAPGAVPTTAADDLPARATTAPAASDAPASRAPLYVLVGLLVTALSVLVAIRLRIGFARRRRLRTRAGDHSPGERVAASWRQACADLRRIDVEVDPAETPVEFARRASKVVEVSDLVVLGARESDRRYRSEGPDEQDAQEAEAASDRVREVVWSRLVRSDRWLADLDL